MHERDTKLPYHVYLRLLGHFLGTSMVLLSNMTAAVSYACTTTRGEKNPVTSPKWNVTLFAKRLESTVLQGVMECTTLYALNVFFEAAFARCILDPDLIPMLLDNSCLIFVLFFITRLWERHLRVPAWLSNGVSYVAFGNMTTGLFQLASHYSTNMHLDHVGTELWCCS